MTDNNTNNKNDKYIQKKSEKYCRIWLFFILMFGIIGCSLWIRQGEILLQNNTAEFNKYANFNGYIVSSQTTFDNTTGLYYLDMIAEKINLKNCTYYDYAVGSLDVINILINKQMYKSIEWSKIKKTNICVKQKFLQDGKAKMFIELGSTFLSLLSLTFCLLLAGIICEIRNDIIFQNYIKKNRKYIAMMIFWCICCTILLIYTIISNQKSNVIMFLSCILFSISILFLCVFFLKAYLLLDEDVAEERHGVINRNKNSITNGEQSNLTVPAYPVNPVGLTEPHVPIYKV